MVKAVTADPTLKEALKYKDPRGTDAKPFVKFMVEENANIKKHQTEVDKAAKKLEGFSEEDIEEYRRGLK